ncbi:MAG: hypothetical protein NTV94_18800 [Planctomycetota bacterium]|nr:hypothetical protein [Planctomycetota bacterium]
MTTYRSHHGGIYVAVLGVCLLVMTLGLGVLMATRARAGTAQDIRNTLRVQAASTAAVELARLAIASNPSWRTSLTNAIWSAPQALGTAEIRWRAFDWTLPAGTTPQSVITIEGLATLAGCTRVTAVSLQVRKQPLDVLSTTLHASGAIANAGILTTSGKGISTASTLTNNGLIRGDASALVSLGTGSITGTTTILSLAPAMPQVTIFDSYKARATMIAWGGGAGDWTINWPLLSAGINPSGTGTNADGIYTITVPAARVLSLELYRIRGTLVIECGDKACVQITKAIAWESHRTDLPTLLIRHTASSYAQDALSPAVGTLSESALGVNLNPRGSPFNNDENTTLTDSYPSRINGLVHVIFPAGNPGGSDVLIGNNATLHGTLLCTGAVTFPASGATLAFNDALYNDPPDGYYTGSMQIIPGTWMRVAAP